MFRTLTKTCTKVMFNRTFSSYSPTTFTMPKLNIDNYKKEFKNTYISKFKSCSKNYTGSNFEAPFVFAFDDELLMNSFKEYLSETYPNSIVDFLSVSPSKNLNYIEIRITLIDKNFKCNWHTLKINKTNVMQSGIATLNYSCTNF